MKILILGGGQVGSSVAENLSSEENDITLVDYNADRLAQLESRFDLKTVCGHAAHPDVLEAAGARQADMVLAVTSNDETNLVACQVLSTLFHTPRKIARIREQAFLAHPELFNVNAFPVDLLISPEQLVTDYVARLIEFPGALQVLDFAEGKVQLVAMRALEGGALVGSRIAALQEHVPGIDIRIAAIFRGNRPVEPTGDTVIQNEDEVFFISATKNIKTVMLELGRLDKPAKRVIIAGGGNIGYRLASALEDKYSVKLIERDVERAQYLSERLKRSLVLLGDAADEELLEEENIGHTDIFCSVTNDEEANILSAMLAKRLGGHLSMALIIRASYVDLVQSGSIDVAISPKLSTISYFLSHVRHGDVVKVHSLRRGAAEAIEAVAHGDQNSSRVVGRKVGEIRLPSGTTIGAIVKGDEVLMGHKDIVIGEGDHVILFLVDKRHVPEVERLFEPGKPERALFRR